MNDLKNICEELGFGAVRTYIASGNVVFTSRKSEAAIKTALVKRLEAYARKPVGVLLRSAAESRRLSGELFDGLWQDVGTAERLAELEIQLASRHETR